MLPSPDVSDPLTLPASFGRRRPWLILTSLVALLFIGWVLLICCYDIGAPDDHDMLPVFTGSATNPFAEHQEWMISHPLVGDDKDIRACLEPGKWKEETADKLLRDNAEYLAKFDALIQTDKAQWRWQDPAAFTNVTAKAKAPRYVSNTIHLTNFLRLRSKWQSKHHQTAELIESGLALRKYGQGLCHAQGNLLCFLVGFTAQQNGLGMIDNALRESNSDALTLEKYSQAIANSTSNLADSRHTLQMEYLFFKNAVDYARTSPTVTHEMLRSLDMSSDKNVFMDTLHWLELKRNCTLLNALQQQRALTAAMDQGWIPLNLYVDRVRSPKQSDVARHLSGNYTGEVFLEVNTPIYTNLSKKHFTFRAMERLVQIEIQLRLYELRHGHLPASMKALQAEAGNAIPPDPFAPGAESILWNPAKPLHAAPPYEEKGDKDLLDLKGDKSIELKYWWPVPKGDAAPAGK